MKFSELPYKRPDIENIHHQFHELFDRLHTAEHTYSSEAVACVQIWNTLRLDFDTQQSLAHVHFTQNVNDEEFKTEHHFFIENAPRIAELNETMSKKLLASRHRPALEAEFGTLFFRRLEDSLKSFSPAISPLLIEEAQLAQRYTELLAQGMIEFRGETYNLSALSKFAEDTDRTTRQESLQAKFAYMETIADELDTLYDRLVHIRHQMATTLGYATYTDLRYMQMNRTDYSVEDIALFRTAVKQHIVPYIATLRHDQKNRLGYDTLYFHDEAMHFPDGNPMPTGKEDDIVGQAQAMYHALSPTIGEFFDMMIQKELMDLTTRPNKARGGYCTSFPSFGVPFIFSNFNGTLHDIQVLTHEAGHALQMYSSRHHIVPEYLFPTMEACEIHSMSMEFLTWPWMKQFFNGTTDKFYQAHLEQALFFMPYGCAVDEFQHTVYAQPSLTPAERKQLWRELEQEYLPWRTYQDMPFAETGSIWQLQLHIYQYPFYYIDYALAQLCALQFWARTQSGNQNDHEQALRDYLHICEIGGSMTFLDIIKEAQLQSPFSTECIAMVVEKVRTWLDEHRV